MPYKLVHEDIYGPTNTPSLNKSRYFLLFIDDFTRMTWVYFLAYKYEVFEKFLQFKTLAEKESAHVIKTLRIDRGGEFLSNKFDVFCTWNSIRR